MPAKPITPREAASILHVSCDTLRRWAEDGRITPLRTLGGHRRYDPFEVRALARRLNEEAVRCA